MTTARTDRIVFALLAGAALAACAFAYALQHGSASLLPCPYCVLQRYAYAAIALVAVIGAFDSARARIHAALVATLAVAGASLAGWQAARGKTMLSCAVDPVGEFVNGLPMARWWPDFLMAEGSCADARAAVLGVPIPIASLAFFVAIFAAAAWRAAEETGTRPGAGFERLRNAFGHSFDGIASAWRTEGSFRLEVLAAALLIPLACVLAVTALERILLIGSVLLMLIVELLNCSVEAAIDRISLERHPLSKKAKDTGSAAVLLSIVLAVLVWAATLVPRFLTASP